MYFRFRAVPLAAAFFLLSSGAAWAQLCSVQGNVKAEDGGPQPGATIQFDRTDGAGKYQVKTDKKGHYYHGGLPHGIFRVSVWLNGKELDSINGIAPKFAEVTTVDFDLQATAKRKALLKKAVTSGGTLTRAEEKELSPQEKMAIEAKAQEHEKVESKNKELTDTFEAGHTAFEEKRYDDAVTLLAKASAMDANQYAVWVYLAQSYAGLGDSKTGAEQQDVLQKACDAFQKAFALKDDPGLRDKYAMVLYKMNKTSDAQAELEKAAAADPANAGKYYYNVGAYLVNIGQTEAAGAAFKRAIELDPNFAEGQFQYAVYLSSKMPPPGADGRVIAPPGMAEALQKYLALSPNGPNAEAAKNLLAMLGTSIQTGSQNSKAGKKR